VGNDIREQNEADKDGKEEFRAHETKGGRRCSSNFVKEFLIFTLYTLVFQARYWSHGLAFFSIHHGDFLKDETEKLISCTKRSPNQCREMRTRSSGAGGMPQRREWT
jgi:hypothetical protein